MEHKSETQLIDEAIKCAERNIEDLEDPLLDNSNDVIIPEESEDVRQEEIIPYTCNIEESQPVAVGKDVIDKICEKFASMICGEHLLI